MVELAVTIAILAIVGVAMCTTMATASSTSDLTARRSQVESYARRVAEVARSRVPIICNGDAERRRLDYRTAINEALTGPAPVDITFDVTEVVSTTDPGNVDPENATVWKPSCLSDQALARVTITATTISSPVVTASVSVVQRDGAMS